VYARDTHPSFADAYSTGNSSCSSAKENIITSFNHYFLSWSNKELPLICQNVYLHVLYLRMTGLSLQNMFIITTGETTVSLQIPHRSHKSNILYAGLVEKTVSFSGTICRSRVSKHFHKKKYYHSY
jgi:hypothetical protein